MTQFNQLPSALFLTGDSAGNKKKLMGIESDPPVRNQTMLCLRKVPDVTILAIKILMEDPSAKATFFVFAGRRRPPAEIV